MVSRCNMLLVISDFLSSEDLVWNCLSFPSLDAHWEVQLNYISKTLSEHCLILFLVVMFFLPLWKGLAEAFLICAQAIVVWDWDGTMSKLSLKPTWYFYSQIGHKWSRNVEFMTASFRFRQLDLTISLRVFNSSCHSLIDICVLKLWSHPSSSRSKTYIWVVKWFFLHSVLEKVPAAAPNGLSTVKNVTSYQFSKFAVHTFFQFSRESLRCGSQ